MSGAEQTSVPDQLGADNSGRATLSDSIGNFAELVAAGTPTPGGGSVAAYCGVLAASLGQMMCNLTIGKAKYAEVEPRIKEIKAELERLGARLRELIAEDAASFDGVMAAYRLPKDTDEQKAARKLQIESATRHAAGVPFDTARRAIEVLRLLGELAGIGNPNAFPDVTVGGQLAQLSVKGAYYNVGVNLSSLSDQAEVERMREQITSLVEEAKATASEIESSMLARI